VARDGFSMLDIIIPTESTFLIFLAEETRLHVAEKLKAYLKNLYQVEEKLR
jgi:hypothetical protein